MWFKSLSVIDRLLVFVFHCFTTVNNVTQEVALFDVCLQTTTRGFSIEKYECRKKKKILFPWKPRPSGQTSEEASATVWGVTSSRRTVRSLAKNNTERSTHKLDLDLIGAFGKGENC